MAQAVSSVSNCFAAQTSPDAPGNTPMNPDVGGFVVGISNIIINVCLSILSKWSKPSDLEASQTPSAGVNVLTVNQIPRGASPILPVISVVDTKPSPQLMFRSSVYGDDLLDSAYGLFSQVYPILLATVTCIGHQRLTLFEAHFAVAVSASPISVYLAWMAFHAAFHTPRKLFHVARYTRTVIALWLGLLLPFFWLALNLIVSFRTDAFINSHLCEDMNLPHWLEFQVVSNFVGVLDVMGRRELWNDLHGRGGLGVVSVATLWVWGVYFVHHLDDIAVAVKRASKGYNDRPPWRRWPSRIWAILKSPWDVIVENHPWLLLAIVCCLHWSWILGIVGGISLNEYQFTYGQALSIFSVVPSVVATLKLASARCGEIHKFIASSPPRVWKEMIFVFIGKKDASHLDQPRDLLRMCARASISLVLTASLATYIWNYATAGSIPNPRTVINSPHENWKPFSIGVYICGFLIGSVNVWFWSHYRARATRWLNSASIRLWTRTLLWSIHLLVIFPFALFMCVAPLFSSFTALPLAQEQQWAHRCDVFAGEATLEGRSYISQPPRASLLYTHPGSGDSIEYEYIINYQTNDSNIWTFDLKNTSFIESVESFEGYFPSVRSIAYDLSKSTMSAMCMVIGSPTSFPCMWGHFDLNDYFSIFLNDTRTVSDIKLRAVDRQWYYRDDAPSFTLNKLEHDGRRGDMVMQSAVTKRNHCELLKVCLSSNAPGLDILAPLGLVLWAEDRYTTYCTTPRLYG